MFESQVRIYNSLVPPDWPLRFFMNNYGTTWLILRLLIWEQDIPFPSNLLCYTSVGFWYQSGRWMDVTHVAGTHKSRSGVHRETDWRMFLSVHHLGGFGVSSNCCLSCDRFGVCRVAIRCVSWVGYWWNSHFRRSLATVELFAYPKYVHGLSFDACLWSSIACRCWCFNSSLVITPRMALL